MSEPTGRPARYQRTFSGLIGSMIVLLIAVAVFVGFRALFRTDPDGSRAAVDWQTTVLGAQAGGDRLVHPTTIPDGGVVTSANYRLGATDALRRWDLGVLVDKTEFLGLAQQGKPIADLVSAYVDQDATTHGTVTLDSPLGRTWQVVTDDKGDYGVAIRLSTDLGARLAGQSVVVYGTVPAAQVRSFAESLTGDELAQTSPSPTTPAPSSSSS